MGRYGSYQEETGTGRYGQSDGVWDTDDFGDMDQYEKMMLMKSFKKKKPQESQNSRYDPMSNWNKQVAKENFEKGFNEDATQFRKKEALLLVKTIARLVLNMIKHQSKRNEIGAGALMKHKEIGYQMLRKLMKKLEAEVNREEEVELFVERFCPEEVIMALEEFSKGEEESFMIFHLLC
jgi:hypothetical protein